MRGEGNFDLYGWDIGARTCKPFSNSKIANATFKHKLEPIQLVYNARIKTNNPTILVTCDKRYYLAFRENIINSIVKNANCYTNVHFHLVDSNFDVKSSYLREKQRDDIGVAVSVERTEIKDKAYYASARFIRANEIIKLIDDNILIMDADAYIHKPIQELFNYAINYDLGLFDTRGPWGMVPWRKYWAGCMFIAKSKAGLQYATVLRNSHFYLWSYDNPNWWIDQNAIYYAVNFVNQNAGKYKIQQFRDFKEETGSFFPIKTGETYKLNTLREFDKNDIL